jgi:type I restriction enzyme S subunit
MSEYQLFTLGQICSLIKDGTHGTHPRQKDGIPLISAKDVQDGRITISSDTSRISREEYKTIHRSYEIKEGDLLISLVGSIGRCALVTRNHGTFSAQRSVGILRSDSSKVDPKYLYHATCDDQFQKQLLSRSKSTAQAGVYLGELAQCSISLPPLPEQKKIAEILSGIDSTTDNLRSYLGKQEILRKSLISELIFSNNSNLDGSCNTGKYCLGDISTRITDGTHQAVKASRQGTIPFLYVSCVKDGMIDWSKSAFITEDQYAIATQGRQPSSGDILYTAVGSYGNAAMVTTDHRFCFQRHIALIQLDREKSVPKFIELALSSDQTKRSVDLVVAGNAQPTLTLGELRKLQIPVPTPDTQRQICEIISPLERKISALEGKINALRNLKHSVSSDLLSGRRRVSI